MASTSRAWAVWAGSAAASTWFRRKVQSTHLTPSASPPGWVAVDDFNQDGTEDIVATRSGADRVAVRYGTQMRPCYHCAGWQVAERRCDAQTSTRTAIPDLAVANRGSNTVTVFLIAGSRLRREPPASFRGSPGATLPTSPSSLVRRGGCTLGHVTREVLARPQGTRHRPASKGRTRLSPPVRRRHSC